MLPLINKKDGSITIVMLISIVMITTLLCEVLSIAINTFTLAHTRYEYEKQYQIVRAIHDHDFIILSKKEELTNTLYTPIQLQKNNLYDAKTYTKKTKKKTIIQTDLKKQGKVVVSLSTAL